MSVSVHIQGKPFWRFRPLIAAMAAVSDFAESTSQIAVMTHGFQEYC
jgi:hypothetical protein